MYFLDLIFFVYVDVCVVLFLSVQLQYNDRGIKSSTLFYIKITAAIIKKCSASGGLPPPDPLITNISSLASPLNALPV